jgi:hypothetical protein
VKDIVLSLLIAHLLAAIYFMIFIPSALPITAVFTIPTLLLVLMAALNTFPLTTLPPLLALAVAVFVFRKLSPGVMRILLLTAAYSIWPLGFLALAALGYYQPVL